MLATGHAIEDHRMKAPPEEKEEPRRETTRATEPKDFWPKWTGLSGKTLWDWLLLLSALAVPVVVGVASLWFTHQQDTRQEQIESQRSQDAALQAYLDNMSTLLIDEHGTQLRKLDPDEEVLDVIQARTETVFAVLDTKRQMSIVLFLARAQLILKDSPLVSLEGVNLEGINLAGSNLSETSFEEANLRDAQLPDANLKGANFRYADLFGANLERANLEGANFTGARLVDATVTDEQLHMADSLENALMPDGQVYEDWLEDHPVPPPDTDNDKRPTRNGQFSQDGPVQSSQDGLDQFKYYGADQFGQDSGEQFRRDGADQSSQDGVNELSTLEETQ
jgi:hypothetical protein